MTSPTLVRALLASSLALITFGGDAHAQETSNRSITIELMIPDDDGDFVITTDQTRITRYFNNARCECAEADPTDAAAIFKIRLSLDDIAAESQQAELRIGTNCADDDPMLRRCEHIATIEDIQNLRGGEEFDIPVDTFMFPNGICAAQVIESNIWVLYDDGSDNLIDEYYTLEAEVEMDAQPPPLPSGDTIEIDGAEGAVQVTWDTPAQRPGDVAYYHVLCKKQGDDAPLFPDKADDAQYDTTQELCGLDTTYSEELPPAFADLDASYLCGTTSGTSTEIRIDGLENGATYELVLLTVDSARNVSASYLGDAIPAPAIDFWEQYKGEGGAGEGGICLVTSTYGDGSGMTQAMRDFRDRTLASFALGRALIDVYYAHVAPLGAHVDAHPAARVAAAIALAPLAALAAFWEYTGPLAKLMVLMALIVLARRRWRRRLLTALAPGRVIPRLGLRVWPRLCTAVLVLALAAVAAPALAQGYDDPYTSEFQPIQAEVLVGRSSWNAGIKLGPYTPDIDSEFALAEGEVGPYEEMFGGSAVMVQFELERFFLWPAGQLGVSGSVGWMGKTASAFKSCDPDEAATPECADGFKPSPADNTSFRLVPVFLGAVYRFTGLDDNTPVPLVPYARAGLSYYLWWVTQPSGSVAEAPTAMCPDPSDPAADCEGERALGASLGWQASVGLALRAESIDRQAAISLREEFGVEHAGFVAELSYAKVDGFGSDARLSVGDFTWFAGMNFEF